MKYYLLIILILVSPVATLAQSKVSKLISFFTEDGGRIYAREYGNGKKGVVLAHGAAFNMESWKPLAGKMAKDCFKVLAIDFRGYGKSKAGNNKNGLYEDILGAIQYLKKQGIQTVSVLGASMGGGASAEAAVMSKQKIIDRLVLLSPVPIKKPSMMKYNKVLFIASKDEPLRKIIESQYQKAPQPKKIIIFSGNAHAQNIFKTANSDSLSSVILNFFKK